MTVSDPAEPAHVVPAYVITHGRAAPTRNTLQPETLLLAASWPARPAPVPGDIPHRGGAGDRGLPVPVTASREQVELLRLCRVQLSVAEAAVYLRLPVSVVTVIAADLIDTGHLTARAPAPRSDLAILKGVLDGLRNLV